MILAGASVDDVFVIVIFSTFISMAQGKEIDAIKIASIPYSPKRSFMLDYIEVKFGNTIPFSGLMRLWPWE